MTYLLFIVFMVALLFASRVAEKKGLFKQFSIVCGVLAVIGFSAPLLIAWQDQEKSNFIELAVALVVTDYLETFSTFQEQKIEKRK